MPHKTPTPVKWIPPIGEMEIIGKWGCLLKKVAAVQDLVSQLQAHFEGTLRHSYLYGSKARGDDAPGSDVDLLVVLDNADDSARDAVSDSAFAVLEAKGLYIIQ